MSIQFKVYRHDEIIDLSEKAWIKLANCYKEVFNYYWQDEWTLETAMAEIKKGLSTADFRQPILSIMTYDDKIVGFAWIILTTYDFIGLDDMPHGLSDDEKRVGLEVIRFWLDLAKRKKIVIYREIGILKGYQNRGGIHNASKLTIPIVKIALEEGHDVLFYWTNLQSASFKQGLHFGWHPIHFFVERNRVIMKGGVKELIFYLQAVLDKERNIIREMNRNKKSYLCI